MTEQIITGGTYRYLSDIPFFKENGLPYGVVDKNGPDKGGTFLAANTPENYVIVVPFKDLVDSISADKHNKYPIIGVKGGVTQHAFMKQYNSAGEIKKIVVTWNSFYKIRNWIDVSDYKVLIDEYHMVLSECGYREDAINSLLQEFEHYKYYTFLSATGIDSEFEYDFLRDLPHYKVTWENTKKIKPYRIKTPYVYKAASEIILDFLDNNLYAPNEEGKMIRVEQLHIFLNSVTRIKQICDTCNLTPDNVRIICGDKIKNKLCLGEFSVGKVTDPLQKVNFYTKKGYQGINCFTNNGLIIVVTDAKNENTMVSVDQDLEQIVGRMRENDEYHNVLCNNLIHIFSTNKVVETPEEFNSKIEESKNSLERMKNSLLFMDDKSKEDFLSRMDCSNDVFVIVDLTLVYCQNKELAFRYRNRLQQIYSDGVTVRNAFKDSDKFETTQQIYVPEFEVNLAKYKRINFKDLLISYYENPDESYLKDYPQFEEFKTWLTLKECNSLKWNEKKIIKAVEDKRKLKQMYITLHEEGFHSKEYLKQKTGEYFKTHNISLSPKASLFLDNGFYEVIESQKKINNKIVNGYIFGKLTKL